VLPGMIATIPTHGELLHSHPTSTRWRPAGVYAAAPLARWTGPDLRPPLARWTGEGPGVRAVFWRKKKGDILLFPKKCPLLPSPTSNPRRFLSAAWAVRFICPLHPCFAGRWPGNPQRKAPAHGPLPHRSLSAASGL